MRIVVHGVYEHYRGNRYIITDIATSTETGEQMVVYRALYGNGSLYVQSAKRFSESITTPDGAYTGTRMRLVDIEEKNKKK